MTRRLSQSDAVVGEKRVCDGATLRCVSASSTHVGYIVDPEPDPNILCIRRDVWTSWPVIEEADR